MTEVKAYKKILKRKSVDDYSQWLKRKRDEIDKMEEYVLINKQKFYQYKVECVEDGTIFDSFENSYFGVIGIFIPLVNSLIISFGGNILNSSLYLDNIIGNTETKLELYELYQGSNLDILNIISKASMYLFIIMLGLAFLFFIIKRILNREAVVKKMYYNDILRIIDEKLNKLL